MKAILSIISASGFTTMLLAAGSLDAGTMSQRDGYALLFAGFAAFLIGYLGCRIKQKR